MIDGSKKRNRQLAFELQNLHVCEKRSNITLILIWVPQAKNPHVSRKTEKQMFLFVSGSHICAPERETNVYGFSIQSFIKFG